MRAMVIRQLGLQPKGKGCPVVFSKRTGGGYDPVTGGVKPEVVTEYNGSGVRINYSEYAHKNVSIEYGDFQIYLSPVQTNGNEMPQPSIGDVITFLDKTVRVINLSPFNDNSVGCGWKLQVRYG
jgi:hypothetical protein